MGKDGPHAMLLAPVRYRTELKLLRDLPATVSVWLPRVDAASGPLPHLFCHLSTWATLRGGARRVGVGSPRSESGGGSEAAPFARGHLPGMSVSTKLHSSPATCQIAPGGPQHDDGLAIPP